MKGFAPLHKVPIVRLLGGDQFRKFCVITIVILVASVWITCITQEEKERPQSLDRSKGYDMRILNNYSGILIFFCRQLHEAINNIKIAIFKLPRPIRRVCYVQMFAFMGWFPFLFYACVVHFRILHLLT
jgi:solute carrier family 45, member 1/2/4